ncbi:MAG: T9SS type A sorting domain-containing protein [Flavobacteriaceae bacterium]|nr:T9SS type A sorting domain-containing protein [Flavobacteriaceae bacterium]
MKNKFLLFLSLMLLTLTKMSAQDTFSQITSLAELTTGEYLIVGDGNNDGMMLNQANSSSGHNTYILFSPISNPGTSISTGYTQDNVFTINVTANHLTIFNDEVGYVTYRGSANHASFYNDTPTDLENWTYSVEDGLWILTNVEKSDRILQWNQNNNQGRFAAYTSNQVKLKLYKKDSSSPSDYSITVTQAEGGNISPSGTVEVEEGGTVEFTATADACYTFSHWIVDGENAGNTNPYVFTNVTADHTISAVFEAVALETPTAEAQEFCEGATVADLVAEGTEIKWYDAEDATMPLSEDTVLVAGTYYATQTIDGCESEKLAVEVTLTTAPIIITQPTDQTLSIGETATFSVEAEDAAEFQWSLSADDGITWTEIDGETASTYTTEPVTEEMNGNLYRVTVINDCGELISDSATLIIQEESCEGLEDFETTDIADAYLDGEFTNNEITWTYGHSRNEGDFAINGKGLMLRRASDSYLEATFEAGVGTFSFEYRKAFTGGNERQLEIIVNGEQVATTPVFGAGNGEDPTVHTFTHTLNIEGPVTLRIKNLGETDVNRQAVIDNISWTCPEETCETPLPTAEAQIFCEEATVADLVAEGENIQWYETQTSTEPLAPEVALVTGTYYVTQTIDCESDRLAVEVLISEGPVFTLQPTDQTVNEGETATFTVEVEGALEYQWSVSNDHGATWAIIDGAIEATYTTEPATPEMDGNQYRVAATNDCGETISEMAVLTLVGEPCFVEDFETTELPGAYGDGSFTNNGITWTYAHSRNEGDFPIDGKGLMLRRALDSYLEATIPAGAGVFSFEYRKAFTGGNERQLELSVNGVQVATTPVFGDVSGEDPTIYTFTYVLNTTEEVVIRIKNVGETDANRQTVIDNINWTCLEEPCDVPAPIAIGNFEFVAGDTLADLEDSLEYTGTLTWYADEELTIVLPNTTLLEDGAVYFVTQTIGECESEALMVETQELGVDSFAFDSFSYYPNPVKDYLYLRNNSKIDNLEIYNLAGAKLMSQTINAVKADLNLKGLDAGIYILKINSGKEVKTVKIIKK